MKQKTCFLIDDDEDDQEIFALALKDIDPMISCVVANDATEALDKLARGEGFIPDYIFLDLNMPRISGKQCLIEIKKQEHLNHIPVIIYSTSTSPYDKQDTQELGATAFLSKPPHLEDLVKALNEFLFTKEN